MKELNKKVNIAIIKLTIFSIVAVMGFLLFMFGCGDIDMFLEQNGEYLQNYNKYYNGPAYMAYGSLCLPMFMGVSFLILGVVGLVYSAKEYMAVSKEFRNAMEAKAEETDQAKIDQTTTEETVA